MTLEGITIAGVDESISPLQLGMLSGEFPFVEWGVLYTPKRSGSARYPSLDWIARVRKLSEIQPMKLSLHLCGQATRAFSAGMLHPWHEFQRVQMNGYEMTSKIPLIPTTASIEGANRQEIVLQVRNAALLHEAARHAAAFGPEIPVSVLFDASGGRGVLPDEWPVGPAGYRMGYAGGIGPDTVVDVVRQIYAAKKRFRQEAEPFWIDMESGVRSAHRDRIDIGKVREVLSICQGYIENGFGDGGLNLTMA